MKIDAPYWRTDIGIEDDLVEEVARIRGYDDIPTTPLSGRIPPNEPDDARSLRDRVKDLLAEFWYARGGELLAVGREGAGECGPWTPGADEAVEGGEPAPCRAGVPASQLEAGAAGQRGTQQEVPPRAPAYVRGGQGVYAQGIRRTAGRAGGIGGSRDRRPGRPDGRVPPS